MKFIQSIDTKYNGYYFRSRLEARWAVFFDNLNWKFLYEPQAYDLGEGVKYLPDFYLPEFQTFIEIKFDVLDPYDYEKARMLVDKTGIPIVILDSDPSYGPFTQIKLVEDEIVLTKVNFIEEEKGKLLENNFLTKKEDYEQRGHPEVVEAINKAREHRFGIFD